MHPALLEDRVTRQHTRLFVAIAQGLIACLTRFFLAVSGGFAPPYLQKLQDKSP
jgi:hypothetical protein